MLNEFNYHDRVMGCDFKLTFITETVEEADKCFIKAKEIADSYENKFSRFYDHSELARLNENKTMEVSSEFLEVYETAYDLYKKTEGKFNPLLQVSQIGYNKSFEKVHNETSNNFSTLSYDLNMDDICVERNSISLKNNQELDFGGFLKGCVAEKIADTVKKSCNGIIINIGGDTYIRGLDVRNKKFIIEITHPFDNKKNINVPVFNKSLCTSGTYKRKWKIGNNHFHHILDSQTKESSASDIVSISVIHEDGSTADALATMAVSLGSEKAKEFFLDKSINFVIICKNGDIIKSDKLN